MLNRVLIANRGEIAIRIIRSCRELGIETVAVYSTADRDQLHVMMADDAICIGGPRSQDSYLNVNNILTAAIEMGCDGIHPGYGFLSENPDFARLMENNNIKFIGPSADIIELMGEKSKARELMMANGVPTVPGSEGVLKSLDEARELSQEIGYPVLIKASSGGGGRGMRAVFSEDKLEDAFNNAKAEALQAFGNDEVYLEKLILNPKHIEFQILADNFGNIVHLGERECSIQRKNQKMIEESPSSFLSQSLREEMGQVAVRAAEACNYENAGTVEFIVDGDGNYYFIEMNTRIQVEHPVTEMVTGVDLLREQLRIASGLRLPFKQEDIKIQGHALEVRVNAENPLDDFRPHAGTIDFFFQPGGFNTRFDTFVFSGCEISPFYDSMIGKIIVHGDTRLEAVRRMRRAIEETIISGVETNLSLQYAILHDPTFLKGDYSTGYLEENLDDLLERIREIGG